jgi:hypothetical protein
MVLHALYPGMHVEALVLDEHTLRELQDLLRRIVIVAAIARKLARLRETRNAHVQIVEPQGIRQRTIARQCPVLEAELSRRHVLHVVVDPGPEFLVTEASALGLDERRAHRACIVERAWHQDGPHAQAMRGGRKVAACDPRGQIPFRVRGQTRQCGQSLLCVLAVAPVGGDLSSAQHAGVGHAPLIGEDLQVGARQRHVRRQAGEIVDGRAGVAVDHAYRRGLVHIGVNEFERLADRVFRGRFIRRGVVDLEAAGVHAGIDLRRCVHLRRRGLRGDGTRDQQRGDDECDACGHGLPSLFCLFRSSRGAPAKRPALAAAIRAARVPSNTAPCHLAPQPRRPHRAAY